LLLDILLFAAPTAHGKQRIMRGAVEMWKLTRGALWRGPSDAMMNWMLQQHTTVHVRAQAARAVIRLTR
jgi:hypothetical protein